MENDFEIPDRRIGKSRPVLGPGGDFYARNIQNGENQIDYGYAGHWAYTGHSVTCVYKISLIKTKARAIGKIISGGSPKSPDAQSDSNRRSQNETDPITIWR